jgi:hypothetical protein
MQVFDTYYNSLKYKLHSSKLKMENSHNKPATFLFTLSQADDLEKGRDAKITETKIIG